MFNDLNNWEITKIIRNLEDLSREKKKNTTTTMASPPPHSLQSANFGFPVATKRKLQNRPSIAQGRARLSAKSVKKLRNRPPESLIS